MFIYSVYYTLILKQIIGIPLSKTRTCQTVRYYIDRLEQKRRISLANALELHLYCTYPNIMIAITCKARGKSSLLALSQQSWRISKNVSCLLAQKWIQVIVAGCWMFITGLVIRFFFEQKDTWQWIMFCVANHLQVKQTICEIMQAVFSFSHLNMVWIYHFRD